ncbi:MAG TPA: SIMPL domain-containing protein [Candidatus Kapabacteria bacterium]|nr:SIMPL domain-containing protein [Candidatus Kapabacteria bacterium]
MKKLLFILFLLSASSTVFAQGYDPRRTISVQGTAEVMVAPDQVEISMSVETNNVTLDKAREENDSKVSAILAMVKKMGVEDKYIQTDYMSVEPRYDQKYGDNGQPSERVFLGYYMTKHLSITLRDVTKYEKLIAEALKLGTNYVNGATFGISDSRKIKDQARLDAIKSAKEKATALAAELGQKVGKPLMISEGTNSYYPATANTWRAESKVYDGNNEGVSTAPGQIKLEAEVSVVFELE